jgi:hypothetical protein
MFDIETILDCNAYIILWIILNALVLHIAFVCIVVAHEHGVVVKWYGREVSQVDRCTGARTPLRTRICARVVLKVIDTLVI